MDFYLPSIGLGKVSHYMNTTFHKRCKEIFSVKDIFENTLAVHESLRVDYELFASIANEINENVSKNSALYLAGMRFLKEGIEQLLAPDNLIEINRTLTKELLKDGQYVDFVDEDSGEVFTYIKSNNTIYYCDPLHIDYANETFLKIAIKPFYDLVNHYSLIFDNRFTITDTVGGTSDLTPLPIISKNVPGDVRINHKLFWDNEVTEFEGFFNDQRITLMNQTRDLEIIFPILKEIFVVGEYGGSTKSKKTTAQRIEHQAVIIPQMLRWNGSAAEFARKFSPLIVVNGVSKRHESNTTLFYDFSATGVRNPIVRILYDLFFVGNKKRVTRIGLEQAFKDNNS